MQNNDPDSPSQQQADTNVAASEAQDTIRREAQSAKEALDDARDEITRKAGEYASEAKAAAMEQAEVAQKDVSASLAAFGGALHRLGSVSREQRELVDRPAGVAAGAGNSGGGTP